PIAFTEWFDKALDRKIDKRFQTAKEFAEELAAAFEQGPPSFSAIHNLEDLGLPGLSADSLAAAGVGGAASAEPPTKRIGPPDLLAQPPAAIIIPPPRSRPAANGRAADVDVPVVFSDAPPATPVAASARISKPGFIAPQRTSDPTTDTQYKTAAPPEFRSSG